MTRRAVISGVGIVSAFGVGSGAFFAGLARGASAIAPIRSFDAEHFPIGVAGEVPVVHADAAWVSAQTASRAEDLAQVLEARGALRDRKLAFGLVAAAEAWSDAGCTVTDGVGAWTSLGVGLEQGFLDDLVRAWTPSGFALDDEAHRASARVAIRAPTDGCVHAIRALLGLSGPFAVHASACAAGVMSVAHAASLIERGHASLVLCGAVDSMVNPLAMGSFHRLGAPSPRRALDACRPFDRRRDGLVIGEGAAIFVVEDEARARSRGARIRARILGSGATQDAYRATAPHPDGTHAAAAIVAALRRAGLEPGAVDYVSAHGTGTPLNDPAEARALHLALGAHGRRVPVSSIKGAVGHLMAASGAIEIASCLLAFERGVAPGTTHHRELDPEIELDVIGEAPRALSVEIALSNSFGFGGQNAAIILGAPR